MEITVTKEALEHGFNVGKKVYVDKLRFPDKYHLGGANELQADIYGFIAETQVCEYFGYKFPELIKGANDEFDLIINNKKIDVKKVGYSRYTKKPKITVNKKSYDRKKDLVDAFLFCTFNGNFQQQDVKVNDKSYRIFLPTVGFNSLNLIGWIESLEVEKVASVYVWKDKEGNPVSESYKLSEKHLKPMEELIE